MYAPAYFRWIGVAIAKRAAISANDDDGAAAGPERRITPIGPRLGATRWAPIRPTDCGGTGISPKNPLHVKTNLSNRINVICPVQTSPKKYFAFAVGQIGATSLPHPFPARGALAIVTNAGGDAVDATASGAQMFAGRFSVSEPRRAGRTTQTRTAKPCGPGTRCWCQVGGGFCQPNRVSQNL
jgi:hypothetical protein